MPTYGIVASAPLPAKGPAHKGSTGREYLLTGLAICFGCGSPLMGSMKQLRNSRKEIIQHVPYLMCKPRDKGGVYIKKGERRSKDAPPCVSIMTAEVDALVLGDMWQLLDQPAFLDRLRGDPHSDRRDEIGIALDANRVRRHDLGVMWAGGMDLTFCEAALQGLATRSKP